MTSIRRFLSHAALGAFAATLSFASISHAQVRQTNIYIDNGSGAFTDLKGGGAGTITFPAATGFPTINTSAGIALFTGPTLGNTWTYTLPDASATLATTDMLSGGTLAGSFTTLTSSGNSTIATGASTTNTFGNGGATLNNIGDDATNNWFGRDNTATSMTNNFGLTSNSGNTLTNLIGISTQGGATVNTQIGNGGTDVTVSISSQNWSVTGSGAATFTGATVNGLTTAGIVTNDVNGNLGTAAQVPLANGGTGVDGTNVAAFNVLAGPNAAGPNGNATFRPLVAGDLPDLSGSYIANNASITPQASASFNIDGSGTLGGNLFVGGNITNNTDNNIGSTNQGQGAPVINWDANAPGYAGLITNEDAADAGAAGLLVKVYNNNSTTAALDVSQNSGINAGIRLFTVFADGSIGGHDWSVDNSGNIAATSFTASGTPGFSGDGSGLTNVPDGALSSNVALLNGNQTFTGTNTFSNPIAGDITGNAATVTTDANLTGDVTSVGNVTTIANVPDGALSSNVALLNGNQTFTGTNTFSNPIAGDITGNAATVTTDANLTGDVTSVGNVTTIANVPDGALSSNVALLNGNQTFTGTNTFSNPLAGDITGNAATVTTDANLTGDVTSVGNVTTIANVPDGALSSNVALLNGNQTFTGTNTFSNPIAGDITGNAATVTTDANLTGDVTSVGNVTTIANVPDGALSSNVALLNGNQTFTGTNTFSNPIAGDITGTSSNVTGIIGLANGGTAVDNTSIGDNLVFAGPITGGPGAAGFRALDPSDLPAGATGYVLTAPGAAQSIIPQGDFVPLTVVGYPNPATDVQDWTTFLGAPLASIDGSGDGNFYGLSAPNNTTVGSSQFTTNSIADGNNSTNSFGNGATAVNSFGNGAGTVNNFGNGTGYIKNYIGTGGLGAVGTGVNDIGGPNMATTLYGNVIVNANTWSVNIASGTETLGNTSTTAGSLVFDDGAGGFSTLEYTPFNGSNGAPNATFLVPREGDVGPYTLATTADISSLTAGFVQTAPATAQTIQPTADIVPLTIQSFGGTSDVQDWVESNGTTKLASIDASGDVSMFGTLTVTGGDIEAGNPLAIEADGGVLTLGNTDGVTVNAPMTFTNTTSNHDITGTSSTWSVTKAGAATFNSDVSTGGHVISTGTVGAASAPVTVPANDVSAQSVLGSDVAGVVTLSTTEATGVGSVAVAFTTTYASAPVVIITPANAAAVGSITNLYVSTSTSGFTINFADFTNVSGANFNYIVVQP